MVRPVFGLQFRPANADDPNVLSEDTLLDDELETPEDEAYWSAEELAGFTMHPGRGRILAIRPGGPDRTPAERCLTEAGYCLGRLPITRDPSHLPTGAATFAPDVIYLSLQRPLPLCLTALETLAHDRQTLDLPLVALIDSTTEPSTIEEAYTRSGCDFFRTGSTHVELLARTHLLVRMAKRIADPGVSLHERPIPAAANEPTGQRVDLRDPSTGAYGPTYLRHRLAQEVTRAHRYQRELSIVALRCPLAGTDDPRAAELVATVQSSCRDVDLVARKDADLFILVLPETHVEGATRVCARLEATLRERGLPTRTASATLGAPGDNAHTAEALLQRASERTS